ncbi:MAG: hypothetical protein LW809_07950 [Vampirovibrionales bacterium]|jgi:hypothetical protein|nr:hypothetical protein [Vampirovibrionales bacterium]
MFVQSTSLLSNGHKISSHSQAISTLKSPVENNTSSLKQRNGVLESSVLVGKAMDGLAGHYLFDKALNMADGFLQNNGGSATSRELKCCRCKI